MSGPPKKIFAFRVLDGTVTPKAKRDKQELEEKGGGLVADPFRTVPKAPNWLPNVHAQKEWQRLAPILVANRILNEANLGGFSQLCSLHGKLVQLWAAGEPPSGHLISQYRQLLNDYGLTPVSSSRVAAIKSESEKANRFSRNGAQVGGTST